MPHNLVNTTGKIIDEGVIKNEKIVGVAMEYFINDIKIRRNQYFPMDKAEVLDKLYKEKKEVVIGVVPENVRRGYLNIEESLK